VTTDYQWFSAREQAHLQRLIYDAWPHRHGPYATDFAAGIVEWAEKTHPDRLERLLDVVEQVRT
jgi:hypothetical protein